MRLQTKLIVRVRLSSSLFLHNNIYNKLNQHMDITQKRQVSEEQRIFVNAVRWDEGTLIELLGTGSQHTQVPPQRCDSRLLCDGRTAVHTSAVVQPLRTSLGCLSENANGTSVTKEAKDARAVSEEARSRSLIGDLSFLLVKLCERFFQFFGHSVASTLKRQ